MARKAKASRKKIVVRSSKTGRFVKRSAAKYAPSRVVTEDAKPKRKKTVEVTRSTVTGRFVKKSASKRHPRTTSTQKVKR